MNNAFDDIRPPVVDPFKGISPPHREDIAPVQQTYLPWQEAVYRFLSNIPRSALENVKDAAMLVRPFGRAAHGPSTGIVGDYTAFPGLQDLGALVGQVGIAGIEKATGTDIMPDKKVLDGLLAFYEANYGMGPEGLKGFERFVTEDPVGFLTDLMMFASVGAAGAAGAVKTGKRAATVGKTFQGLRGSSKPASVGEAFTRAWKEGKTAVAYENYAPFVVKVNHVLNRGFVVPSRLQGLFRSIPVVRGRLTDVPVSFGPRAGKTDTGFQMGLAEVADPAAHVFRGTFGRAGRLLGKKLQRREAADAAERHDVDLPLSAKAVSPSAAAAEASRLKADDPEMHARVMGVYESLDRIADETVQKISEADEPDIAANLAVEGYEAYVSAFKDEMNKLYEGIEDLNRIPAVLTHTKAFFDEFAVASSRREKLMGPKRMSADFTSLREMVEAYAQQSPEIVDPQGRPVGGGGGGTPPGASGKGDTAEDVSVRRTHRSGTGRMVKGNWGGKYQAEYAVVELEDLVQSHLPDGTENPAYDPNLQPRDRADASSQLQVDAIANNLDPDLLLDDTSSMNDGAPIIGDDLMVESGNGRVMGMKKALESPVLRTRLDAYKRQLLSDLGRYGLSTDDVGSMRYPVLVRKRLTDVDRTVFVKEANDTSGKSFRSAEGALMDARLMDRDLLQTFSFGDEKSLRAALSAPRNRDFVQGFIARFPNDKQGAFFDKGGKDVVDEGYARIERAMLLSVFDNTYGAVMASRFADVGDPGLVNIRKAVYAALPELAQLKYLIEDGERRADLDFFEDIAQAVLKVQEITDAGRSAADARAQKGLFGEMYDDLSDDAARILLMVERGKQSPNDLTEFLRWYARQVDAQGSVQQGALFETEAVAPVTKAEILQSALGQHFEDIPDISVLRRASRGNAPVEGAPSRDVGRGTIWTEEMKAEANDWLRAVYANAYGHNIDSFSEYMRSIFDNNPENAQLLSGFDTADEAIKWVRENSIKPEDVETRIDELRVAVRTGKPISLKGKEFQSYRELAVLSQALRDPSVEWSHVFYIKREGDVHHVVGHETTTLNSGTRTRTRGYKALQAEMETLKADGMVFLHNHPSASATFSKMDRTSQWSKLGAFGDAYLGDIVINSGTYAFNLRKADGEFEVGEDVRLSAEELGWDPQWDNPFLGSQTWQSHIKTEDPLYPEEGRFAEGWMSGVGFNYRFKSAQDILKNLGGFGRQMKIDNNWVVLNMVSSWDRLNAVVQVRGDQLAQMPLEQRTRFLRELAQQYGGEQVHVFVGKGDWYSNRQQAWDTFSTVNNLAEGGGIMSVMVHGQKSGWVNKEPEFYNRTWKAAALEEVAPVEQAPGPKRLAMEHMTINEETYRQILNDREFKVFPELTGNDQIYFSMGNYWRHGTKDDWGFIYSTSELEKHGLRLTPEFLSSYEPFMDFAYERFGSGWGERFDEAYAQFNEEQSRRRSLEGWVEEMKGSELNEFSTDAPLRYEDVSPVGVIEAGVPKFITEETRGSDPSKWEFRGGKQEDYGDMAVSGVGRQIPTFMSHAPEPPRGRGLEQTRTEQLPDLFWEDVKEVRTDIGEALFSRDPDPIVSRDRRFYTMLYEALTADLSEAVARHAPERAGEFEDISRQYAEGHAKINKGWGLKILRSAQKGEQEKLVRAIFKPDMPVEQIPLVYELFGGKESEGGRAMQSAFIRELIKKSKSADGAWLPMSLRRQLNAHGDKRLRAFFDDETVSALNDMADISISMADFAKMAHGSQTAFLAREMLEGSMFGGALQKLAWRVGTGPVGWFLLFADIVGQQAASRFFTSPEGEAFLMRGGVRTAVGEGAEWLTRGAQGQLARAANRAVEGEVR